MENRWTEDNSSRILVVDDEEVVLSAVADYLKVNGFEVYSAPDASSALAQISEQAVDLVLTDIRMPGMNGIELLGEIRQRWPDLGVVMMTGFSEMDAAVTAMKTGAYDYISKPFNYEELFISIERALEKSKLLKLSRQYHHTLEQKVMEQSRKIREMYTETIASLTSAIEAKDEYTKGHSIRVTEYVQILLEKIGLDFDLNNKIIMSSQLHDIGKLGISDNVLNKPGKLTDEEFSLVRGHPITSEKILKPILDETTVLFVRHHHERWDGKGYPDGLSGHSIPVGSRIIALADTFDAMTSRRAYRDALELGWAYDEIERCTGSQFDPELAPIFIEAVKVTGVSKLD